MMRDPDKEMNDPVARESLVAGPGGDCDKAVLCFDLNPRNDNALSIGIFGRSGGFVPGFLGFNLDRVVVPAADDDSSGETDDASCPLRERVPARRRGSGPAHDAEAAPAPAGYS